MSLPPLPWSYETNAPVGEHEGKGFVYLLDANGRKIGTVWGKPDEKMATVQFMIDATEVAKPPVAPNGEREPLVCSKCEEVMVAAVGLPVSDARSSAGSDEPPTAWEQIGWLRDYDTDGEEITEICSQDDPGAYPVYRRFSSATEPQTAGNDLPRHAPQTIETAPRDGTHILAWRIPVGIRVTNNTHPPTVVHWFDDPDEPGFYTSVNERAPEHPFNPTHWERLCDPPAPTSSVTRPK